jgi:hypothetical protein
VIEWKEMGEKEKVESKSKKSGKLGKEKDKS